MKKIIFGNNKNIIGKNLKSIRKEKHLTQSDLAAKIQTYNINMDQQMIRKSKIIPLLLQIMSWLVFARYLESM